MLLVVRIRTRRRRGKNNKFWMDMGVITARMIMTKRANLGEPKREQEGPEQGDHQSPGAYPLFSEDSHVTLTLLPPQQFLSFLTNTGRGLDVDNSLLADLILQEAIPL
jgi:hypothetical protein